MVADPKPPNEPNPLPVPDPNWPFPVEPNALPAPEPKVGAIGKPALPQVVAVADPRDVKLGVDAPQPDDEPNAEANDEPNDGAVDEPKDEAAPVLCVLSVAAVCPNEGCVNQDMRPDMHKCCAKRLSTQRKASGCERSR